MQRVVEWAYDATMLDDLDKFEGKTKDRAYVLNAGCQND